MEDIIIRTLDNNELDMRTLKLLCGENDEGLKYLSERFAVSIAIFGNELKINGDTQEKEDFAEKIIMQAISSIHKNINFRSKDLRFLCDIIENGDEGDLERVETVVIVNSRGKQIRPKTLGQANYVRSILRNNIVFGVGPAGTGKTYLAVALAVKALKNKDVERIILTRPAVEAGEKLGFLPGDLDAKVDPYLRPLYDALQEMLGLDAYNRALERGAIEVAPLAYMRGRTLSDAFIILDEAQNTTREQMKMFLTRMGEGSKIVVTGDITQIDLPRGAGSGLIEAMRILDKVDGIEVNRLTGKDVVRHEMVMRIVEAYEKYENGEVNEKVSKT